jgi:hypothetical protein
MTFSGPSIRPIYAGRDTYNERILDVVRDMSDAELQVRPTPDR